MFARSPRPRSTASAPAMDAFVVAFQVPNLLRSLVADSALSAAFVPTFTELDEQGRRKEAARLAGAFVGLISLVLGIVTLIAVLTAPWVMPLFAPNLPDELDRSAGPPVADHVPDRRAAGADRTGDGDPSGARRVRIQRVRPRPLERDHHRGAGASARPILDGDAQIYAYAVGILVGTAVQLRLPAARAARKGAVHASLWAGATPTCAGSSVLMVPVTIGLGLINFTLVVNSYFADRIPGEGAIRAIDAAFRLYILPQGIFSVAVSTVLFPLISRMAARGDIPGMRQAVTDGTRQIFFLLIPATVVPGAARDAGHAAGVRTRQLRRCGNRADQQRTVVLHGGSGVQRRQPAVHPIVLRAQEDVDPDQGLARHARAQRGSGLRPLQADGRRAASRWRPRSPASPGSSRWVCCLRRELGGFNVRWMADGFVRTAIASVWLGALGVGDLACPGRCARPVAPRPARQRRRRDGRGASGATSRRPVERGCRSFA